MSPSRFSPRQRRRAEFIAVASLALFVAILAGLALTGDSEKLLDQIASLDPVLILGMLGLALVNFLVRWLRWRFFEGRVEIRIPPLRSLLYFLSGFAFTATPGKAGEVFRAWLIERCHGYRYARILPLMIGDRLSDGNGALVLCAAGVMAFPDYAWTAGLGALAVLGVQIPLFFPALGRAVPGLLYRMTGKAKRLLARIRSLLRYAGRLFRPPVWLLSTLCSVSGWLCESLAFWLLLSHLGVEASFQAAMFIFVFSSMVGALAMLPGGLGGTEATMFALLLLVGADKETAVLATGLIRLTTLWFAIFTGFCLMPLTLSFARKAAGSEQAPEEIPATDGLSEITR